METAYHEAGHAVAARSLGIEVETVTITPDEEAGTLGAARTRPWDVGLPPNADVTTSQASAEADMMCLFAGLEAQRLVDAGAHERGASDDEEKAAGLAAAFNMTPEEIENLRDQSRRLVAERADQVRRVAQALLDLDTLIWSELQSAAAGAPVFRESAGARGMTAPYTGHMSPEQRRAYEERQGNADGGPVEVPPR